MSDPMIDKAHDYLLTLLRRNVFHLLWSITVSEI